MEKRDPRDLAALFAVGLSFAAAACATTTENADGPLVPEASSQPSATTGATASAATIDSAAPITTSVVEEPPRDDGTPEGYAAAFRPIGPYTAALSGLELLGFADVVDGKMMWDGKECPAEWNALVDGTFTRAAVVKKSRTLAVITPANFERWVGPIDSPEKAALRAQLEPGRTLATCSDFVANALACSPGSTGTGAAVRLMADGFEVATFDTRNVCRGRGRGNAVTIGVEKVTREGQTQEATNTLTTFTYDKARGTMKCSYPRKGRAYEGFVDTPLERTVLEYHLRARDHEAAAAIAFDRLAGELERHGAPVDIVRDARLAAADERRHAALFARAAGLEEDAPLAVPAFGERALGELLLENAEEGCANETYSAILATHQASRAPTEELRTLFAAIASDEQRHAELSHRIHAWGIARVDRATAVRVRAALDEAIARMSTSGDATRPALDLGEPQPALARAAFSWVVSAMSSPTREERAS